MFFFFSMFMTFQNQLIRDKVDIFKLKHSERFLKNSPHNKNFSGLKSEHWPNTVQQKWRHILNVSVHWFYRSEIILNV